MSEDFHPKYWLDLLLTEGIGNTNLRRLLATFETPKAAATASLTALKQIITPRLAEAIRRKDRGPLITKTLNWSESENCHLITFADPHYPPLLLETADAPPLLYAWGDLTWLTPQAIAIVGSRNASSPGVQNTKIFAQTLSDAGFVIISGLAQGIDAAAHRGALAGASGTIAVIGTGINITYPKSNRPLAAEILNKGLLLSEYPLDTPPAPGHFPRRNRIISGMSRACLIIEATLKSGSLTTATMAAEQGREVFAVPGSINSPMHRGCHRLIKEGASLAENVEDIFNALGTPIQKRPPPPYEEKQIEETIIVEGRLLTFVNYEPTSLDDIAFRTGIAIEILLPELLELEVQGKIVSMSGGRYQRV